MKEADLEDWNMAKAYFMRIDEILTGCCISRMKKDYLKYFDCIISLYIEIEAKIPQDDKENIKSLIEKIIIIKNNGLKNDSMVSVSEFIEVELQLRSILEKRGMLTPKKDLKGL